MGEYIIRILGYIIFDFVSFFIYLFIILLLLVYPEVLILIPNPPGPAGTRLSSRSPTHMTVFI